MDIENMILKPVSKDKARKILSSTFDRSVFLDEYKYFKNDGNRTLYRNFILQTLRRKKTSVALSTDVVYFAIEIDLYSKEVLEIVLQILSSKRSNLIKLACLDYISHFKNRIPKSKVLEINTGILIRTRNVLLRIQSLINLIPIDKHRYFSALLIRLEKETHATVFYRVLNSLNDNGSKLELKEKALLRSIIIEKGFQPKILNELLSKLRS